MNKVMKEELVSIIMPCYNAERFIQDSINSVLAQSYQNWELLISNDNSKDNSKEIVLANQRRDKRIKFIDSEENVGPALTRNKAISIAKGRYIAFLDSDDMWDNKKLQIQVEWMKSNNIAFSYSSYRVITEEGVDTNKDIIAKSKLTYRGYLRNTLIGCLTVIIDRKMIGDFKMSNIKSSQDMALWLEIMKRGFDAYGCDKILASYRLVSTSNTSKKWKAAMDVWRVYREIENLSLIYSAYNFLGYAFNAVKKRL